MQSRSAKRSRRGPSPPPTSVARKRERVLTDEDEEIDPFFYEPAKKKKNNTTAPVRAVGKYARIKRKISDSDSSDDEIPRKIMRYL